MRGKIENFEVKQSSKGTTYWILQIRNTDGQLIKGSCWDDATKLIGQDVDYDIQNKQVNGKTYTNIYIPIIQKPKKPSVSASDVIGLLNAMDEKYMGKFNTIIAALGKLALSTPVKSPPIPKDNFPKSVDEIFDEEGKKIPF